MLSNKYVYIYKIYFKRYFTCIRHLLTSLAHRALLQALERESVDNKRRKAANKDVRIQVDCIPPSSSVTQTCIDRASFVFIFWKINQENKTFVLDRLVHII